MGDWVAAMGVAGGAGDALRDPSPWHGDVYTRGRVSAAGGAEARGHGVTVRTVSMFSGGERV